MARMPLVDDQSIRTAPRVAPNDLVHAHLDVAKSIAGRYRNRGIDQDDLEQVAMIGLLKAAQRFDAEAGHDFLAFAVPTIRGELRRHFRDAGWMVRPPRRVQELQARISRADEELVNRLGRSPRPSEIAAHLDALPDQVVEALSADGCFTPTSLDATVGDGDGTLGAHLGHVDLQIGRAETAMLLKPVVAALPDRERRILQLRFYDDCSQQEIAEVVGVTQAQVSRVLRRILSDLRGKLTEPHAA